MPQTLQEKNRISQYPAIPLQRGRVHLAEITGSRANPLGSSSTRHQHNQPLAMPVTRKSESRTAAQIRSRNRSA